MVGAPRRPTANRLLRSGLALLGYAFWVEPNWLDVNIHDVGAGELWGGLGGCAHWRGEDRDHAFGGSLRNAMDQAKEVLARFAEIAFDVDGVTTRHVLNTSSEEWDVVRVNGIATCVPQRTMQEHTRPLA